MSKRKPPKKSPPRAITPSLPPPLRDALTEAEECLEDGEWLEAATLLESLDQRYPRRAIILAPWLEALRELHDYPGCLAVAEQLLRLSPDDAQLTLLVATLLAGNGYLALSLPVYQRFRDRWPEDERAGEALAALTTVQAALEEVSAQSGLIGEDAFALAALHEQTRRLVAQGEYADARKAARKLLARMPQFTPAWNNIAQSYFAEGRLDQALATATSVLEFDSENVHALSNLVRYSCLSGRLDEAEQYAARLKSSRAEATDRGYMAAEALTFLGDDLGVLEVVSHRGEEASTDAMLYHLAAVAALREGREEEARQFWKRALEISPELHPVQENLADLERPVGEREGPWAFPIENWVPTRTLQELMSQIERITLGDSQDALTRTARAFLRRHPHMLTLIPIMLDRADPTGRKFIVALAGMAATPETQAALRDFALSRRGTDSLRLRAAQEASAAGLLTGSARLWLKGEWRDIDFMQYELHDEPLTSHAPEVEALLRPAVELLRLDQPDPAEDLLLQAMKMEPEAPDILNNLAAAYERQGRSREANILLKRIHDLHPDYIFSAANLAMKSVRAGKIAEAEELLAPFVSRTRLHFGELASLASARIEIALARHDLESARVWLGMWAGADPDHPRLDHYEQQVEEADAPSLVPRWRR